MSDLNEERLCVKNVLAKKGNRSESEITVKFAMSKTEIQKRKPLSKIYEFDCESGLRK